MIFITYLKWFSFYLLLSTTLLDLTAISCVAQTTASTCNNQTNQEICSSQSTLAQCGASDSCYLSSAGGTSFSFTCVCNVKRLNPCVGLDEDVACVSLPDYCTSGNSCTATATCASLNDGYRCNCMFDYRVIFTASGVTCISPADRVPGSSTSSCCSWWWAFLLIFILLVILIGVLFFLQKRLLPDSGSKRFSRPKQELQLYHDIDIGSNEDEDDSEKGASPKTSGQSGTAITESAQEQQTTSFTGKTLSSD